jgi:hypothetical protein
MLHAVPLVLKFACNLQKMESGTARRSHVWDGVACEHEDKETSDNEGPKAGLNQEIVASEWPDFDDSKGIEEDAENCNQRGLHHMQLIPESFSH